MHAERLPKNMQGEMKIRTIWGYGVSERRKPWLVKEEGVRKEFVVEAVVAARVNAKLVPYQSKSSSSSPFYNHQDMD